MNDTADLYFELPNSDGSLRPGQKMGVTLDERASEESLVVPWSAVLHDINGGAWVYENVAPQQYARRRVEVRRVVNSLAVLARGPAVGDEGRHRGRRRTLRHGIRNRKIEGS